MKIERDMSIDAVMERMGDSATRDEAATMVEFLLVGDYVDTDDIPEDEWLHLCDMASQGYARNRTLADERLTPTPSKE